MHVFQFFFTVYDTKLGHEGNMYYSNLYIRIYCVYGFRQLHRSQFSLSYKLSGHEGIHVQSNVYKLIYQSTSVTQYIIRLIAVREEKCSGMNNVLHIEK